MASELEAVFSDDDSSEIDRVITCLEYQCLKASGARSPTNGYILRTSSGSSDEAGSQPKKKAKVNKKKRPKSCELIPRGSSANL